MRSCSSLQRQLEAIAKKEILAWCRDARLREDVDFSVTGKKWWIRDRKGGRNLFWPIPFGDSDVAVDRIWGLSLAGAMIDEGVNLAEGPRNAIVSRVSETTRRAFLWTTNPAEEEHPFKVFIDTTLERKKGKHYTFAVMDNPNMDDEKLEDLGLACPLEWQKRRYLYGEWCGPSGNVWPTLTIPYPNGAIRKIGDEPILSMAAGVDFGARAVTAVVFVAVTTEGLWIIDEWRHDGRERGMLSERAQVEADRCVRKDAWIRRHRVCVRQDCYSSDLRVRASRLSGHPL